MMSTPSEQEHDMDTPSMDDEIVAKIDRAKAYLAAEGVEVVQPPNPYCLAAVLAGAPDAPEIILNLWGGEPESVEFLRDTFPAKMLPRVAEALGRAIRIVDGFPV